MGAAVLWVLCWSALGAAESVPEGAHGAAALEDGDPRVEAMLVFDAQQVAPGQRFGVGVRFKIDPEWHIYWRNSGDAGLATEITWRSDGARFGPLQWPTPEVYAQSKGFIVTVGYAKEVLLFAEATVSESASGELEVQAVADFLTCKVDCIPGRIELRRTVPIGQSQPSDNAARFELARSRLPVAPEALGLKAQTAVSVAPIKPGDVFKAAVSLRCQNASDAWCAKPFELDTGVPDWAFIPDVTPGLKWKTTGARVASTEPIEVVLGLEGRAGLEEAKGPGALAGLVRLKGADGQVRGVYVSVPVERAGPQAVQKEVASPLFGALEASAKGSAPVVAAGAVSLGGAGPDSSESMTLWQAIFLGFIGGMLLNLMPCVLPVLAIKVLSFVKLADQGRSAVLKHALAYTAGVCGAMLALAAVVLAIQAAGTQVGWGFQFQEPVFVAVLAAVMVLFALNLFGVFEINVSADAAAQATGAQHGLRRSAAEGALAVVVATPCSAPLMGSAVGFALTGGPGSVVAVFLALGLGLALPFVLLTLLPGARRWLPRPGAWMMTLKQVLAFLLLGTAIWLAWIVGQVHGVDGVTGLLIFLLGVGGAGWLYGSSQHRSRRWPWWLVAVVVLVLGGATGARFGAPAKPATAFQWQPFEPQAISQTLAEGRLVFVDFTADWCITCKVNERTVLVSEPVLSAIEEHNVAMFKADWTQRDERIRAILATYGKAGVPMYLLYRPGAPQSPVVLPELLTETMVVEAMSNAAQ